MQGTVRNPEAIILKVDVVDVVDADADAEGAGLRETPLVRRARRRRRDVRL